MKSRLFGVCAMIALATTVAWTGLAETVTNVRGVQRENSNLVDIYYDLESSDGGLYSVAVQVEGRTEAVTAATFTGDVGDGIAPGKNKHVVWDAGADWPKKKGDVKAIVTVTNGKVQLWEGGPYWADRNIGANAPEDYGLYFWWGDTTGHRPSGGTFSFNFYNDNLNNNSAIYTYGKSVAELQSAGWVTSDGVLAPAHDAAHVKWGGAWRMPTFQELYDLCYTYCDWTWTTRNGVNGYVVRGRGAYSSNSIFVPFAGSGDGTSLIYAGSLGIYWSSVPRSDYYYAYVLYFNYWGSHYTDDHGDRSRGYSVRPVQGSTK